MMTKLVTPTAAEAAVKCSVLEKRHVASDDI